MRSFMEVMQQSPLPDHIIIEASGVAEPSRIAGFASVDRQLRLDGIVTLVDAGAIMFIRTTLIWPTIMPNRLRRRICCSSPSRFGRCRDIGKLENELAAQKPNVPIAQMTHGVLPIDLVLGLNAAEEIQQPHEVIEHGFMQWATHLPPQPRATLIAKLENLRPHVLRAKAVLQDDEGAYVLHLAGGRISTEPHEERPQATLCLSVNRKCPMPLHWKKSSVRMRPPNGLGFADPPVSLGLCHQHCRLLH